MGSTRLFFSYSSHDAGIVVPLGRLLAATGSKPFLDADSLTLGGNWQVQIDEAIRSCHAMLVFWSEAASKSEQVRREYLLALQHKKPIVPVLLCDQPALPADIAHIHGVQLLRMFEAWPEDNRRSEEWLRSLPKGSSLSYTPPSLLHLDQVVDAFEAGLRQASLTNCQVQKRCDGCMSVIRSRSCLNAVR